MKITPLLILLSAALNAAPAVIDDAKLTAALHSGIEEYAKSGAEPTADALATALKSAPKTFELEIPKVEEPENPANSVYILSFAYLCGKCDKWHLGGTSSAWALTEDGLMVTNHHCINNAKGAAMGVCDISGNVHRVIEIVAADEANDIAVFRVDAKGLKPLPISPAAALGTEVEVISHPKGNFFSHTYGKVSRYHRIRSRTKQRGSIHMTITADFAVGSSGAPVLNDAGSVVGMVSSTQSINSGSNGDEDEKVQQMVMKHCVPSAAISAMMTQARTASPAQ